MKQKQYFNKNLITQIVLFVIEHNTGNKIAIDSSLEEIDSIDLFTVYFELENYFNLERIDIYRFNSPVEIVNYIYEEING